MKARKASADYSRSDMMNQLQIMFAQNQFNFMSLRIKAGIQRRKAKEQEKKVLGEKEGVKK